MYPEIIDFLICVALYMSAWIEISWRLSVAHSIASRTLHECLAILDFNKRKKAFMFDRKLLVE